MARRTIVPIILAAGPARRLGFPHALAEFRGRTAMEIAVENCLHAGLGPPLVVLGFQAARARRAVPKAARVLVHREWRAGMLSSICAGLRQVPRDAAFLLYPVDLPLLAPSVIRRLVRTFHCRGPRHVIVSPVCRGQLGHPVIFAPTVRAEFARARTARDVVERDPRRVKLLRVSSPAVYADFDTPAQLRRLQRAFARLRPR